MFKRVILKVEEESAGEGGFTTTRRANHLNHNVGNAGRRKRRGGGEGGNGIPLCSIDSRHAFKFSKKRGEVVVVAKKITQLN